MSAKHRRMSGDFGPDRLRMEALTWHLQLIELRSLFVSVHFLVCTFVASCS